MGIACRHEPFAELFDLPGGDGAGRPEKPLVPRMEGVAGVNGIHRDACGLPLSRPARRAITTTVLSGLRLRSVGNVPRAQADYRIPAARFRFAARPRQPIARYTGRTMCANSRVGKGLNCAAPLSHATRCRRSWPAARLRSLTPPTGSAICRIASRRTESGAVARLSGTTAVALQADCGGQAAIFESRTLHRPHRAR